MCGIFGSFGHFDSLQKTDYGNIGDSLFHRGPNDGGYEKGQGWALGFRRLSILDLSPRGHQPMSSADRKHWIVFNGEIYNYIEIRKELEQRGERFSSGTDTEVLLRLLMRDGVTGLNKLNGMFAFAYVDIVSRKFLICRDRLGVKPLYYWLKNGELRFGSELKALLAWPKAERTLNTEALAEYLALNYLPSEQCIFKDYAKLSPGTYIKGSIEHPDKASLVTYWHSDLNDEVGRKNLSEQETDDFAELLLDATRIRLRSDVPVGVFLSGGIDSGLIAAMTAKCLPNNQPLALTVAFSEEEYNEATLAQGTAEHVGLPQQIIHQKAGSLDVIDELAWYFDEPFGDASALPTYMLCKAASAHATVFLSGDGGDESFGGYRRYTEARRYKNIAKIISPFHSLVGKALAALPVYSPLRYKLMKMSLPDAGYAATFDGIPSDPAIGSLAGPILRDYQQLAGGSIWRRWHESKQCHLLTRQQRLDFAHYLPDDILVKMDRASMANSIEVRSPFLSHCGMGGTVAAQCHGQQYARQTSIALARGQPASCKCSDGRQAGIRRTLGRLVQAGERGHVCARKIALSTRKRTGMVES
jgi:asparagine synthase (glutamine-hydrolysing)